MELKQSGDCMIYMGWLYGVVKKKIQVKQANYSVFYAPNII